TAFSRNTFVTHVSSSNNQDIFGLVLFQLVDKMLNVAWKMLSIRIDGNSKLIAQRYGVFKTFPYGNPFSFVFWKMDLLNVRVGVQCAGSCVGRTISYND